MRWLYNPVDKSFAMEKCTTCNNDQMHNRPLTVCNAKSRTEVEEKKKKKFVTCFPSTKQSYFWLLSRFLGLVIVRFQEQIQLGNPQLY